MTLDVLIHDLHGHNPQKTFDIVDTLSNMQLVDLNYKPYGGPSITGLIDRAIDACFYPPPGSGNHILLCLHKFHGPIHHQLNFRDKPNTK